MKHRVLESYCWTFGYLLVFTLSLSLMYNPWYNIWQTNCKTKKRVHLLMGLLLWIEFYWQYFHHWSNVGMMVGWIFKNSKQLSNARIASRMCTFMHGMWTVKNTHKHTQEIDRIVYVICPAIDSCSHACNRSINNKHGKII